MPQVNLKEATITIKDGASHEVVVKMGDGNLTFSEGRNIEYKLDRGIIDEVREGDDVPVDVSLTAKWMMITPATGQSAGGVVSVEEAIKGIGSAHIGSTGASGGYQEFWVSSDADPCRPYAVDIEIVFAPPCNSRTKTVLLPDFRWEKFDYDAKAGTIQMSGKCNVKTVTTTND